MALHEHPIAESMCSDVLSEVELSIAGELQRIWLRKGAAPLTPKLLDVGCWDGAATARYAHLISADAYGIEISGPHASQAKARGITVSQLDLESDPFPWPSHSFDLVIANQVFEHLKNIWLPFSEVYRVLRPGGSFVISVPNLASLHNRLFLLAGLQPTSIRTLGPHVRGYTVREMIALLTLDEAYDCRRVRGVGFYPLPARFTRALGAIWPSGSHTMVLTLEKKKTASESSPWYPLDARYSGVSAQTHYSTIDPAKR